MRGIRVFWELLVAVVFLIVNLGYGEEIGKVKNNHNFIYLNSPEGKKYEKYYDIVWKTVVMKDFKKLGKSAKSSLEGVSKDKIGIIVEDLDDDGIPDIIATITKGFYYCLRDFEGVERRCKGFVILVKPDEKHKPINMIDITPLVDRIDVSKEKYNGLKKLVLNRKFELIYDGKEYKVDPKYRFIFMGEPGWQKYKKYYDVVWKMIVLEDFPKPEDRNLFEVTKEDIGIMPVDLNDDGMQDIIATVINRFYCGDKLLSCDVDVILTKPNGTHKIIGGGHWFIGDPIYVSREKTNGLRNIYIRDSILKYNGKHYEQTW
uniref:Uncharacterized protein n=1 Tax=Hydrogenobacter sp. TaxID=2152829 RepID=A0A7C2V8E0_9AQUI